MTRAKADGAASHAAACPDSERVASLPEVQDEKSHPTSSAADAQSDGQRAARSKNKRANRSARAAQAHGGSSVDVKVSSADAAPSTASATEVGPGSDPGGRLEDAAPLPVEGDPCLTADSTPGAGSGRCDAQQQDVVASAGQSTEAAAVEAPVKAGPRQRQGEAEGLEGDASGSSLADCAQLLQSMTPVQLIEMVQKLQSTVGAHEQQLHTQAQEMAAIQLAAQQLQESNEQLALRAAKVPRSSSCMLQMHRSVF